VWFGRPRHSPVTSVGRGRRWSSRRVTGRGTPAGSTRHRFWSPVERSAAAGFGVGVGTERTLWFPAMGREATRVRSGRDDRDENCDVYWTVIVEYDEYFVISVDRENYGTPTADRDSNRINTATRSSAATRSPHRNPQPHRRPHPRPHRNPQLHRNPQPQATPATAQHLSPPQPLTSLSTARSPPHRPRHSLARLARDTLSLSLVTGAKRRLLARASLSPCSHAHEDDSSHGPVSR
jgi:hypothetical protein